MRMRQLLAGPFWKRIQDESRQENSLDIQTPIHLGGMSTKNNGVAFEHLYSVLFVSSSIPLGGGVGLKVAVTRRSDILQ